MVTELSAAGFEIVEAWDTAWAIDELLKQLKRKLVGAVLAQRIGTLPDDVKIDAQGGKAALQAARAALDEGIVGYGALVAQKI